MRRRDYHRIDPIVRQRVIESRIRNRAQLPRLRPERPLTPRGNSNQRAAIEPIDRVYMNTPDNTRGAYDSQSYFIQSQPPWDQFSQSSTPQIRK